MWKSFLQIAISKVFWSYHKSICGNDGTNNVILWWVDNGRTDGGCVTWFLFGKKSRPRPIFAINLQEAWPNLFVGSSRLFKFQTYFISFLDDAIFEIRVEKSSSAVYIQEFNATYIWEYLMLWYPSLADDRDVLKSSSIHAHSLQKSQCGKN